MKKNIVGIVVAANPTELGGEHAPKYIAALEKSLKKAKIDYVSSERVIWNAKDALEVTEDFNKKGVSVIALIHACWLRDNLQYLVYNASNCPVVLISVPGIETFSMASVQHFASELYRSGKFCRTISSALDSVETVCAIKDVLDGARAAETINNAVIGSFGPRQTWRTAGAQDLTFDEWDLTDTFGALVVHIETSEWDECLKGQSDAAAKKVLQKIKKDKRFDIRVSDAHLLTSCKSYLAIKELIAKYHLTCAAAQCYPEFGGMSNLTACLLADEGFVLDTEGDLSHALMMSGLNAIDGRASVLAEWGTVDDKSGVLYLTHEGSSALSRMPEGGKAVVQEAGDGLMIGYKLCGKGSLTAVDFSGQAGYYQSVVYDAELAPCTDKIFEANYMRLTVALKSSYGPTGLYNKLIEAGSDHHFLLKEGDIKGSIAVMNDLLGVETMIL